jgi:hypothetical protein
MSSTQWTAQIDLEQGLLGIAVEAHPSDAAHFPVS